MRFKASEIATIIKEEIAQYKSELDVAEVGRVLEIGDGVARVYGLSNAMAGEMLEFASGATGVVFNLEENSIGAVVLGAYLDVKEGEEVRTTGKLLSVPVGEAMVGRVVDPLGRPLDGKGPIMTPHRRPMEIIAPGIAERQPVNEPLQTGIKAIDAMIPIGRGQRELIIGDRKTGKTAIAIDTIINQRGGDVICVYVAIGQKESTVAALVEKLREHRALDYSIVVVAGASDPAPLQYVAPYAGCAMAEYFVYEQGRATLCVYDDLSKQAQAYRQLSLLLRRPPGREAYPGDVFYLHSRLLERSCKLADRRVIVRKGAPEGDEKGVNGKVYVGNQDQHALEHDLAALGKDAHEVRKIRSSGGSLTALPVIETLEGEVSAYIPTNVISITDGQIYLEPDLFFAGVRPAVNVGISVSRVGGNAQVPAMKKIAGSLRLDLAAFRELEAFAQLGTELDPATQRQLDRGRRMVELLKQPQYEPMDVIDQVLSIHAGTRGFLDDLPLNRVREFEQQLLKHYRDEFPEVRDALVRERKLTDELDAKMKEIVGNFKKRFSSK
ncbi:MAG: F0F1 ATP synthase subunit alpha [Phycisphaerae bacterium]|jgi:F-type H+-transporting ATPase subunit alpha|nr:F0F1 ATP synthase subunit alpha [Phycisphaerae bacterium]MCZ2398552.1 F0F1 ATP synthase subunit alpha [Phycisphaerae bacterium]NUQ49883.1 F0F1 ATP synthase subunit alpha [Phycisphaerae bacterium]